MSYVTSTIFVNTQCLRQHSNWLSAPFSPIVQTVSKSPDLLVGFDLFQILSITQVEARFLAATWWCSLGPFFQQELLSSGFYGKDLWSIRIDQQAILVLN